MISALESRPYFEMYEKAAHQLCYGAPGSYGSLFMTLGPLRSDSDMKSGTAYALQRPGDVAELRAQRQVPEWNLDFTLPVEVVVVRGEQPMITVEEFVGGLVLTTNPEKVTSEDIGDAHVNALSTAIRAEYETHWLDFQEKRVSEATQKHAGKRGSEIENQAFRDLATDTVLRKAHITHLRKEMRDHVRSAHHIAHTFPGTGEELMRDRAIRAITRPDREHLYGQYAMTPEEGIQLLRTTQKVGVTGE